jgi:hypothetical protein
VVEDKHLLIRRQYLADSQWVRLASSNVGSKSLQRLLAVVLDDSFVSIKLILT